MPGLDIELLRTLFEIIQLPGIVYPGACSRHMPGEGDGVGPDGPDPIRQIIIGRGRPIELPAKLPAQKFLGDEFGIVPVAAAVEIAEDDLVAVQRKMNE